LEFVERCLYHKNISVKQISAAVSQDKEVIKKGKEPRWILDEAQTLTVSANFAIDPGSNPASCVLRGSR
jgi:hypothetical protein